MIIFSLNPVNTYPENFRRMTITLAAVSFKPLSALIFLISFNLFEENKTTKLTNCSNIHIDSGLILYSQDFFISFWFKPQSKEY